MAEAKTYHVEHSTLSTHRPQRLKSWREQHKLHGIKEITLAAPISTDHSIRSRREWMDFRLLFERPEVGYCNLLDVHRDGGVSAVVLAHFLCVIFGRAHKIEQ